MCCLSCASDNETELAAEMIIHFSGIRNLDKPGVWVFPNLLVCLNCGFSRFTVPETELPLLASGAPTCETLTLEGVFQRLELHSRLALRKGV